MAKDSVEKILAAEAEAEQLIKDAKEEAKQMIQKASQEADDNFAIGVKEAKGEADRADQEMIVSMEPKVAELRKNAEAKGRELTDRSHHKINEAIEFLKGRVFE